MDIAALWRRQYGSWHGEQFAQGWLYSHHQRYPADAADARCSKKAPDGLRRLSKLPCRARLPSPLPGPPEVEAVALGAEGILAGIKPGAVYIDLSSNSPTLVRRLHDIFRERGVHMLDAPVSGGVIGARTGLLAVMVGGDEALYQRVKPVLDAIGAVVYCGAMALAQFANWCTTPSRRSPVRPSLSYSPRGERQERISSVGDRAVAPLAVALAAFIVCRRAGLAATLSPDWDKGFFATKLMRKDVGLATQLAREFQVPMALAALTEQELIEAMNHGWGDNPTTIVRLLQEASWCAGRGNFPAGNTRLVIEE